MHQSLNLPELLRSVEHRGPGCSRFEETAAGDALFEACRPGATIATAAVEAIAALDEAGAASAAAFARLPWRLSNDALASSLVRSRLMKTLFLTYGSWALRRCLASARMLLTASTEPSETRSRRLFVDLEGFPRRADFITVGF